ncbi:hypothetical protein N9594_00780 [bacterium]|nr:hypothetical protein [bacterium]
MLQKSYVRNYIQIYLWRGLSVLLNVAALFFVLPKLSSSPEIFGIYSVCISISVFLTYADIGFLKAGVKYATVYFAKKERQKEQRFIGFSLFILLLLVSLISAALFVFSINPDILIKDIKPGRDWQIASKLLCIQAIFSFNVVLQKFVDSVLEIRLENYLSQRVRIGVGSVKILSVSFFFTESHYDIVGYFFFIQIVDLLGHLVSVCIIRNKYSYDILFQLKCLRYDSVVFKKVKKLALGSLYVTATWILYYELDLMVIGKLFGAFSVALYALSFTLLTYYRTLGGIIFSPFQARFNHFIALGKLGDLTLFYFRVIRNTMPFVLFSTIPFLILADSFVLSWVGIQYEKSIPIAVLLVAGNLFMFIRIPGSYIILALERLKYLYIINTIQVVIFWAGVFFTIELFGIVSFALSKFVASFFVTLYYFRITKVILSVKVVELLEKTLLKMIVPVLFQVIFLVIFKNLIPNSLAISNLGWVILIGFSSFGAAFLVYHCIDREFREEFQKLILSLKTKNLDKVEEK